MRASRLLSILLTLTTRGQVSAAELAAELEVSVRTVYRDVEALGAAGIPVYTTRGRAGGIRLLDGYRTKLTGLTADEAGAVFLAGLPAAAADLGLGSVLAASQSKLLASLPPQLRNRAERIRDRFHLDAPGWERATDSPPHLTTIADAVWAERRVEVRYQRSDRSVVHRVLEPLGLVLKAGVWYLVAAVPDDGRARTYRLSRIRSATALDDTFRRPDGFALQEHWQDYQRDYEARLFHGAATVRLSPRGRQLLFLVGSLAARAAHEAMQPADEAGWATTTLPIESVPHAQHAIMQLGAEAEVLAPDDLREAVAASAREMVRRYDGGSVRVASGGAAVAPESSAGSDGSRRGFVTGS